MTMKKMKSAVSLKLQDIYEEIDDIGKLLVTPFEATGPMTEEHKELVYEYIQTVSYATSKLKELNEKQVKLIEFAERF